MFTVDELLRATSGALVAGARTAVVRTVAIDSRRILRDEAFLALKGEQFDGHDFLAEVVKKGCRCLIVQHAWRSKVVSIVGSSGIDAGTVVIAVEDPVKALGAIALFHRRRSAVPVIAVTGSNGKTTVKEMIAWVLSGAYAVLRTEGTKNNHIGVPLTLLNLEPRHEIAVIELGTNHFGEIAYLTKVCEPNVGVMTNIGPSHLQYFGTLQGVYREKNSLIKALHSPCLAILNADDPLMKKALALVRASQVLVGVGMSPPADFLASDVRRTRIGMRFCINGRHEVSLRTAGQHNIHNALVTVAVARAFGLSWNMITARLSTFIFPAGRFTFVSHGEARFIDDTYNSNPLSFSQALNAFNTLPVKGRKILVMGDMLELGSQAHVFHREMGEKAAAIADTIITVGALSLGAAKAARACGFDPGKLFACDNSTQAQELLYERLIPTKRDMVLVKGSRSMKMERVFQQPSLKG